MDELNSYFPIDFGTNATTFDSKDGSVSLQSSNDDCVVVGYKQQGSPTNDKAVQSLSNKKENSCEIVINSPDISPFGPKRLNGELSEQVDFHNNSNCLLDVFDFNLDLKEEKRNNSNDSVEFSPIERKNFAR